MHYLKQRVVFCLLVLIPIFFMGLALSSQLVMGLVFGQIAFALFSLSLHRFLRNYENKIATSLNAF